MSFASSAAALTHDRKTKEALKLEEIKARIDLAQRQMDRSFDTMEKAILQMSDARAQMATIVGVINRGVDA